jgi:hypothetical protein
MVQAKSAADPTNHTWDGYAQVGYGQFAYDSLDIATFTQSTRKCKSDGSCGSGLKADTSFDLTNPGPNFTYRVWRAADGFVHMEAGDTGITAVTTYDPIGDWESQWQSTFAGETSHTASDVPGTANDRTLLDNIRRYNQQAEWIPLTSFIGINDFPSRYNKSALSLTSGTSYYHFTIWTYPL